MISHLPILSLLTFLPLVGMLAIAFVPRRMITTIRWVSLGITLVQVALAILLWVHYQTGGATGFNDPRSFQFVERASWIRLSGLGVFGNLAIDYFMGLDGISVIMVLLTALISCIACISSFTIERHVKGYFLMFLLLDVGMMGTFCALDFFLFYIFWELMLLPMYFLIGIWGGPRREYAAMKFFIYTLLGSVVMLLVMIGLYFSTQVYLFDAAHHLVMSPSTHKPEIYHTFNMLQMMTASSQTPGSLFAGFGTMWRYAGFLGLFFAFAIKIPMFPFHTWLPDAHVEAPTAISVILAGVLLKMGGYGIIRICFGIFPDIAIALSWYIALFGVINIIYGALCAMAQKDFKKLIAYSSISHMGYVLLGISALNSQGMLGAVFQMFNHGVITAMLFLIVGVLADRTHARGVMEFGGLANKMPKYFALAVIAFFASLGLPALSGFISEAFVFIGSFQTWQTWTIIASLGIILTAAYMLWTLQRIFFGTLPERWEGLTDVNLRELATLVPLALIIIVLGIYPSPLLDLMTGSVNQLVGFVHTHGDVTKTLTSVAAKVPLTSPSALPVHTSLPLH